MRPPRANASALVIMASCAACSEAPLGGASGWVPSELGQARQAYVNGDDDRREYYELEDDYLRSGLEQFVVALTSSSMSALLARGDTSGISTWGELDNLCSGEPFADQPAAVFCSGVLVDWDLVLTSGHCVDVLPVSALRVVFDYYYREPGQLAVSRNSVYGVREIITSANDGALSEDRLDYAWLRLSEVARPPHRPAAAYTRMPAVELDDPIINISAGGGVPLKLDAGGRVQDRRAGDFDFFVADTDTSQGSSGSGAFDSDFALLGTLARGAPDFVATPDNCLTTDRGLDPAEAIEEYTYVHRAITALCETGAETVLCSSDCAQPCNAADTPAPLRPRDDDEGCALAEPGLPRQGSSALVVLAGLAVLAGRRRQLF